MANENGMEIQINTSLEIRRGLIFKGNGPSSVETITVDAFTSLLNTALSNSPSGELPSGIVGGGGGFGRNRPYKQLVHC